MFGTATDLAAVSDSKLGDLIALGPGTRVYPGNTRERPHPGDPRFCGSLVKAGWRQESRGGGRMAVVRLNFAVEPLPVGPVRKISAAH